jgi:hypothetical protein
VGGVTAVPRLPIVILAAWLLVTAGLATALLASHAATESGRRTLLLVETSLAAEWLGRPGGSDRLAGALAGRWARSALVRPDVDAPAVASEDGRLVGRAAVHDATTGSTTGTVVVLERPDVPRGMPSPVLWLAAGSATALLALTMAAVSARTTRRRLLLAALAVIVLAIPTARAARWAVVSLGTLDPHPTIASAGPPSMAARHDPRALAALCAGGGWLAWAGVLAWAGRRGGTAGGDT